MHSHFLDRLRSERHASPEKIGGEFSGEFYREFYHEGRNKLLGLFPTTFLTMFLK